MLIKQRVEEIMVKRGMRPKDLVKKTGIPYTTLWRLVTGKIKMDIERGSIVAAALDTSLDYLAGATDNVAPTVTRPQERPAVQKELTDDLVYLCSEVYRLARRKSTKLAAKDKEDAVVLLRMAISSLSSENGQADEELFAQA